MKCPHCRVEFHDNPAGVPISVDKDGGWLAVHQTCPACKRVIIHLSCGEPAYDQFRRFQSLTRVRKGLLVYPKGAARPPCPAEVPDDLANDYGEACLVLGDSPKAAAALARRCLQHLLRHHVKVRPGNLAGEIQELLDRGGIPSHLAEAIDGIRNIGNFAAHSMKSQASGEILPVEPGEAEWNLDVLEALFDFYFVQPEILKRKRDALNKKLGAAGKPPMK